MANVEPTDIEDLVAEALACIEDEGPAALERLCQRHPDSAAALRVRVEWLLETGLAESVAPESSDYPERLGDFRLIEPIGEGGMGVVYRAEQVSLGREVALKLVRPEQLYFTGALQRFEHEVATVAALAHPGIVPVYAVGEESGVPFFAMEHVRGASLGGVLRHLARRKPQELEGADLLRAFDDLGVESDEQPSTLFDTTWPILCTRMIREVAEALEHAHRRGVLHRDVKPSNIMVTRGGRVMLLDFGLSSSQAGNERRTKTGHRVGTLAYMAPEQLRGESALDARTDVFALGVALYELLTLRLPYDASSEAERLAHAGASVPSNLRRFDPRIPWELEVVVQTAADPDPARRYASAADFARDLDNVLANRPIEARRSSAVLRARRWVQRHPAAALAVAVVALGPSLFALQELRANAALQEKGRELEASNAALGVALSDADTARERAERNFERAYESVELMLSRVGGELLETVPHMAEIRRGLLEDALRLHEELLDDPAAGREQPATYAQTLRRTAALRAELGQLELALTALDDEAAILDALLAEAPDAELEILRGKLDARRAEVHKLLGNFEAAEEFGRLAIARLSQPELSGAATWVLASARNELADVLSRNDRPEEARAQLREAIDEQHAWIEANGGTWLQRSELAKSLHLMAGFPSTFLAGDTAGYDPRAGEPILVEALELRRALVAERPDDPQGRRNLADTAIALAGTVAAQMRFDESYALHAEALAIYEDLTLSFPDWPVYADGLAAVCVNLSLILATMQRGPERVQLLERAVELYEGLVESAPDSPTYPRNLALALGQLGHALRSTSRDLERIGDLLSHSLEVGLPVWHARPEDRALRTALLWTTGNLAFTRIAQRDAPGAAEAARVYLELEPGPVERLYTAQFISQAIAIGRTTGTDEAQLVEWTEEALALIEQAGGSAGRDPDVRRELIDPALAALRDEERYRGLLALLDLDLP